jgi:glycosyltransferase involved in cell wall biosynthesis
MQKLATSGENSICIIGPSPNAPYKGGVATHIRNLQSLSCFRDAEILDPGSVNSNCRENTFSILKAIFTTGRRVQRKGYKCLLVNSSIYPGSFLKLMLMLTAIPAGKQPVIHVFFHGGRFTFLNPITAWFLKRLFRTALGKVRVFHFLSSEQREGYLRLFPECSARTYANYSTADETWEKYFDGKRDFLQLLFVGRIVAEKGIHELFSAFETLLAKNEKIQLSIAGDGPDLPELIKHSKSYQPGLVRFLGFVKGQELETAYRDADLLVLPSYQEGFPYVAIEAMRAGLPIISTNTGALDELVTDGLTGFKVPPKDADALAETISRLINQRMLLEEMSRNCHAYFKAKLSRSAAERYYSELIGDTFQHGSGESY